MYLVLKLYIIYTYIILILGIFSCLFLIIDIFTVLTVIYF